MYYCAFIIYLFAIITSLLVYILFGKASKQIYGFIIITVTEKDDVDDVLKEVKRLYYEEVFFGYKYARRIIIVDTVYRIALDELQNQYGIIDYMLVDELCDYIKKKELTNG